MGLVYETEVRTLTTVSIYVCSQRPRQEPCMWYDGHLSHLNQVDFDLRAHSYAQFNERSGFALAEGLLSFVWRASSVRP